MSGDSMFEYDSSLHALIAEGPSPTRQSWQDKVLTYLTQNCNVSNQFIPSENRASSFYPSPLPINVVSKPALVYELKNSENGYTPLLLAVEVGCPADVVAALVQLLPSAATQADEDGALPLHLAAKRSSTTKKGNSVMATETIKTLGILARVFPAGLVSRDYQGKTALHHLLDNHTEGRTVAAMEVLCQVVDKKIWMYEVGEKAEYSDEVVGMPVPSILRTKSNIVSHANLFTPASALAIPDSVHGCLPLHYAVMNGASKEVVKFMIKAYPASVCQVDCMNRTPLHWYFGAGGTDTVSGVDVVTGQPKSAPVLHHTFRSSSVITMLLHKDPSETFDVATMYDMDQRGRANRLPLHYAIDLLTKNMLDPGLIKAGPNGTKTPTSCMSLKSLKFLIDQNRTSLIAKDAKGQTPLHVLFRTVFEWNDVQYKRACHILQVGKAGMGAPKDPKLFSPPPVLVKMLIQNIGQIAKKPKPKKNEKAEPEKGLFGKLSFMNSFDSAVSSRNVAVEEDESSDSEESTDYDENDSANVIEDDRGLLPIHCAVMAVTTAPILRILIVADPLILTHQTYASVNNDDNCITEMYDLIPLENEYYVPSFYGGRTPLHMAFANPFIARLQSEVTLAPLLFQDEVQNIEKAISSKMQKTSPIPKASLGPQVDGKVVLSQGDTRGETPLHLAARNNASLLVLRIILENCPSAAITKSKSGDLPLQLLVDKHYAFVSAHLAVAHASSKDEQNPFNTKSSQESRTKVRDLAKKQTTAMRMAQLNLCGAVFAPTNGWTSDEEETNRMQERQGILQKVNILGRPLLRDPSSLMCACSEHGLLPLHVLIGFHAVPYREIHIMLQQAPESARWRSGVDGYTPLDLHCLRKEVHGEIKERELEVS
jgi:ankyrin repeat protein